MYAVFVTIALILGSLVLSPSSAPVSTQEEEVLTPAPEQASAPTRTPAGPLTVTVSSVLMEAPIVTPTVTVTPTGNIVPPVIIAPEVVIVPPAVISPAIEITPSVDTGRVGLAFHPEHLNAGGLCRTRYSASGSLKNHGPDVATSVGISFTVVSGAEWVDHVEVSPSSWVTLTTSKPGRFTVYVYTNDDWPQAGKGTEIIVSLDASEGAQATFRVRNQCKAEKPDKPEKPGKPENPGKPEEPGKPEKPEKPEKPDQAKSDNAGKPEKPENPNKKSK